MIYGMLLGCCTVPAARAYAQEEACADGRIASVDVRLQPVFPGTNGGALGTAYAIGNGLHIDTREGVVRRELLFREGDCYEELRLTESERLLRLTPYVRSVSVRATRRSDGDYDVSVVTTDEWTLRVEPEFRFGGGVDVGGITLAERNLLGTGRSLDLTWVSAAGPDFVSMVYTNPQWMKTRWDLDLAAGRTEPGYFGAAAIRYPFLGLVGRGAAFVDGGYAETWFPFIADDEQDSRVVVLPQIRRTAQIGAALRRAGEGASALKPRLGTYGLTISYERLNYSNVFFPDSTTAGAIGITEEEADSIARQELSERNALRLNALLGVQALEFVQRQGLTSIDAIEDVALGAAADVTLGLAAPWFGTDDSHLLLGFEGYAAGQLTRKWLVVSRASFESRRDYEQKLWRDTFGFLDVESFWQMTPRNLLEVQARLSAGWNATVPFQLTLGGPDGLRGYSGTRWPGGGSGVLRVEDRTHVLSVGELMDLGTTLFVDVGRMWANEAPFGTNSGVRASWGAGIRFAFPTGSRTTYELVVTGPIDSSLSSDGLIITLRRRRFRSIARRQPDLQLERSRDIALRNAIRSLE